VKLDWADLAMATALTASGCAAIYAGLSRALRCAVGQQQLDTDRQLGALGAKINALEMQVAELAASQIGPVQAAELSECANMSGQPEPKTIAIIAAAATTFLGKKAHIRAAKSFSPMQESAGAWAQQGRVIVQTSHNPRSGS
jgi:hypothetical protein